jgi:predicted RNA-binding protein with PUA-like domain
MNYWLVKQEPDGYAWDNFLAEGGTAWTGIRNFQARNHLRSMKTGDLVLFYHSGNSKEVVGLARVAKEAYPDPTAAAGEWSAVDLVPVQPLSRAVGLAEIKADAILEEAALVRQSRLSVTPLTQPQFRRFLKLAATRL